MAEVEGWDGFSIYEEVTILESQMSRIGRYLDILALRRASLRDGFPLQISF